jgi:hypothetical protein
MRLTDLMSGANLSLYPQIGLVIFLAVFASIVLRVYGRRRADDHARWAAMPLDDTPRPGDHP